MNRKDCVLSSVLGLFALMTVPACAVDQEDQPDMIEAQSNLDEETEATDETSEALSALDQGASARTSLAPSVITFWEDNGCGGDQVGWYTYYDSYLSMPNTSGSGWVNDEARSIRLFRVQPGTVIRVYDNSSGSLSSDDWAEITVNRYVEDLCVYSFQVPVSNMDYTLVYCNDGNLDGKVSLARAQPYAFTSYTCGGTLQWP
jgi:hypothetical protein